MRIKIVQPIRKNDNHHESEPPPSAANVSRTRDQSCGLPDETPCPCGGRSRPPVHFLRRRPFPSPVSIGSEERDPLGVVVQLRPIECQPARAGLRRTSISAACRSSRNAWVLLAPVARSSSIASPKVFDRKRIRVPSCDQSARSPNQLTCRMRGGRWSAGLASSAGSAAERRATRPMVSQRARHGLARFMELG